MNETGHICLSKKKKNSVISNVIGAAAYYGSVTILKKLMSQLSVVSINFLAQEKHDVQQKGAYKKEFAGFTPLMLAVAGGDSNMEVIRVLL